MGTKLAILLKPVSDALGVVYIPAMWALVVIHSLLGVLGLLSPGIAKGQLAMLHGNGRLRVFGIYLMLIGILVFSQAGLFANPSLPQAVSVAVFIIGGVILLIPGAGMIPLEWALDRGPSFFRVMALANILIAGLFYSATRTLPPPDPLVESGAMSDELRDRDREDAAATTTAPAAPAEPAEAPPAAVEPSDDSAVDPATTPAPVPASPQSILEGPSEPDAPTTGDAPAADTDSDV